MTEKNMRITPLEAAILLLTLLFAAGTVGWFHLSGGGTGETRIETSRQLQEGETRQPPEAPEAPGILEGERIDLNTASQADLTRLPGIGEKKAADIVAWRRANGGFQSVDQLTEIQGIGDGTLERLRPYVTAGE